MKNQYSTVPVLKIQLWLGVSPAENQAYFHPYITYLIRSLIRQAEERTTLGFMLLFQQCSPLAIQYLKETRYKYLKILQMYTKLQIFTCEHTWLSIRVYPVPSPCANRKNSTHKACNILKLQKIESVNNGDLLSLSTLRSCFC